MNELDLFGSVEPTPAPETKPAAMSEPEPVSAPVADPAPTPAKGKAKKEAAASVVTLPPATPPRSGEAPTPPPALRVPGSPATGEGSPSIPSSVSVTAFVGSGGSLEVSELPSPVAGEPGTRKAGGGVGASPLRGGVAGGRVIPTGSVSLVTGSSRGIGRGIAIELARLGHTVVINYAGNEKAADECLQMVRDAGGDGITVQGDVSEEADRSRLVQTVLDTFGRIDLLVNNAGVAPSVRADILEAGEASFDRLININLKGPYFLTQRVAKQMIAQAEASPGDGPRPQIVTISSISAYTASINRGDYCISKAGLGMMTALWAARLAPWGIRVYEIRPGVIATDMTGGVKEKYDQMIAEGAWPIKRWGEASDIGRAVAALARGDFPFSTGEVFNVDGGFHLRTL